MFNSMDTVRLKGLHVLFQHKSFFLDVPAESLCDVKLSKQSLLVDALLHLNVLLVEVKDVILVNFLD